MATRFGFKAMQPHAMVVLMPRNVTNWPYSHCVQEINKVSVRCSTAKKYQKKTSYRSKCVTLHMVECNGACKFNLYTTCQSIHLQWHGFYMIVWIVCVLIEEPSTITAKIHHWEEPKGSAFSIVLIEGGHLEYFHEIWVRFEIAYCQNTKQLNHMVCSVHIHENPGLS